MSELSTDDILRRVGKLEDDYAELERSLVQLNTTIALLNQTIEMLSKNEEKRQTIQERSFLFVVGGFISAAVAWVVRGGLGE